MAGHSKWANIKHRKAAQDAKRGKVFTKHIRDIMTAARSGGGDINDNPNLRLALDKARKDNMTKDVMDRAIKRGTGELQGEDYVEKVYEAMIGSVAVVIKTLTDNGTRTFTNVRTAVNKNGGMLGEPNSVMWQFKHCGLIMYPTSIGSEDEVMEVALEAGASEFEVDGDYYKIETEVTDFGAVRDALAEKYGDAEDPDLTYVPTNWMEVSDLETAQKIQKLVDAVDEDDDVQEVITNMDASDEILEQL